MDESESSDEVRQYRAFIANSAEGIWRFEAERPVATNLPEDVQIDAFYTHSYLAECNDALARMYGFERAEDLVGARLGDLLPREIPENREYLRAFIQSGYRLTDVESVEQNKYGEIKHFANSLVGMVENGLLVRAWGTQRDITAQRRLERELAQRERDYAALVDNAVDILARYDRDKRIRYINRAGERHSGLPAKDLIGKTFQEAGYPSEVIPIWDAALDYVLRTGETHTVEFSLLHPLDGTRHHYETVITPEVTFQTNGTPQMEGLIALSRDVTERSRAERALRRSERRYRALVNAASQIVWTNSPEGEMRGPQPGWCALTGQSEDEVQGLGWAEAVHPDDVEASLAAWGQAVRTRTTFTFEHRVCRHDGVYRVFSVRAVPVLNGRGNIDEWVGIHTDITEQRELEGKRRKFMRDVLSSMTEGRLRLCETEADLPAPFPPASDPIELSRPTLRLLRRQVEAAAEQLRLPRERVQDLLIAVGEASMNAVVHAGGGWGSVHADSGREAVQVWVRDTGRGISDEALPRALEKGVSSAGSLGHGFWLILHTCDRIWLLTGASGTTVVLEQERAASDPTWMQSFSGL